MAMPTTCFSGSDSNESRASQPFPNSTKNSRQEVEITETENSQEQTIDKPFATGTQSTPVTQSSIDPTENLFADEMKPFKHVAWEVEDFKDLTILYQPKYRKPNIE
jgi:hypothetical protein